MRRQPEGKKRDVDLSCVPNAEAWKQRVLTEDRAILSSIRSFHVHPEPPPPRHILPHICSSSHLSPRNRYNVSNTFNDISSLPSPSSSTMYEPKNLSSPTYRSSPRTPTSPFENPTHSLSRNETKSSPIVMSDSFEDRPLTSSSVKSNASSYSMSSSASTTSQTLSASSQASSHVSRSTLKSEKLRELEQTLEREKREKLVLQAELEALRKQIGNSPKNKSTSS